MRPLSGDTALSVLMFVATRMEKHSEVEGNWVQCPGCPDPRVGGALFGHHILERWSCVEEVQPSDTTGDAP